MLGKPKPIWMETFPLVRYFSTGHMSALYLEKHIESLAIQERPINKIDEVICM